MAGGYYATITPCFASSTETDCCESSGYGAECYDPFCYECDPTNGKEPISCTDVNTGCIGCYGVVISGTPCSVDAPCVCSGGDCICVAGQGCRCTDPGSEIQNNSRCNLI